MQDTTHVLCLDVKQHIIGFLGLDICRYMVAQELTNLGELSKDSVARGPRELPANTRQRTIGRSLPPRMSEAQKLFPWLSCGEINQSSSVQDLLTVQLLSSAWYHAFHSTVLEADHIIVYRALQMRRKIKFCLQESHKLAVLAMDVVNRVHPPPGGGSLSVPDQQKALADQQAEGPVPTIPDPVLPVQLEASALDDVLVHFPVISRDLRDLVQANKPTQARLETQRSEIQVHRQAWYWRQIESRNSAAERNTHGGPPDVDVPEPVGESKLPSHEELCLLEAQVVARSTYHDEVDRLFHTPNIGFDTVAMIDSPDQCAISMPSFVCQMEEAGRNALLVRQWSMCNAALLKHGSACSGGLIFEPKQKKTRRGGSKKTAGTTKLATKSQVRASVAALQSSIHNAIDSTSAKIAVF